MNGAIGFFPGSHVLRGDLGGQKAPEMVGASSPGSVILYDSFTEHRGLENEILGENWQELNPFLDELPSSRVSIEGNFTIYTSLYHLISNVHQNCSKNLASYRKFHLCKLLLSITSGLPSQEPLSSHGFECLVSTPAIPRRRGGLFFFLHRFLEETGPEKIRN